MKSTDMFSSAFSRSTPNTVNLKDKTRPVGRASSPYKVSLWGNDSDVQEISDPHTIPDTGISTLHSLDNSLLGFDETNDPTLETIENLFRGDARVQNMPYTAEDNNSYNSSSYSPHTFSPSSQKQYHADNRTDLSPLEQLNRVKQAQKNTPRYDTPSQQPGFFQSLRFW